MEIPEEMIDAEAEDMAHEFEYRLSYQNIKLDDYLGYIGLTRDQLLGEYKEQAAKSVKLRLVMEAIVKAEELKFEEKELDDKLAEMAARSGQDVDAFKKGLGKEHLDYLANQILSDKLLKLLKDANGAKKPAAKKAAADKQPAEESKEKPAAKKPAAKKPADGEKPAAKKPAAKKPAAEKSE